MRLFAWFLRAVSWFLGHLGLGGSAPPSDSHRREDDFIPLFVTRLEERRVLNADFAAGAVTNVLDDFTQAIADNENLTVTQDGDSFQVTAGQGTRNDDGSEAAGTAGHPLATLTVEKAAVAGSAGGVQISAAGGLLEVGFDPPDGSALAYGKSLDVRAASGVTTSVATTLDGALHDVDAANVPATHNLPGALSPAKENMQTVYEQAQNTGVIDGQLAVDALHDILSDAFDVNVSHVDGLSPTVNVTITGSKETAIAEQSSLTPTTTTAAHEVVFVDPRVADYEWLIDGARDGVEVVLLDPNRDGLEQIAEHLKGREDLTAVHIVSHGSSGQLLLGSTVLTSENLGDYQSELDALGGALASDGDVLFYGCNLGEGDRGATFLSEFAAATQADVAASLDYTGAQFLGGNWILEATTGTIDTGLAFTAETQAKYGYVFVEDTTPPTFDSAAEDLHVEATGPDGAVVNYDLPTATDDMDPDVDVTGDPASGTVFPLGTTNVTLTATDDAGNQATQTFEVTVEDTTPPTFDSVVDDIVVEATGPTGATVTYALPTASDTVDPSVEVTGDPASGTVFPLGTTNVTLTATDDAGNQATQAFEVTVEDTTPPTFDSVVDDIVVEATGPTGATVTYALPTASDTVDPSVEVTGDPASGTVFPLGTTAVTLTATDDSGNQATQTFDVAVEGTRLTVDTNGDLVIEDIAGVGNDWELQLDTAPDPDQIVLIDRGNGDVELGRIDLDDITGGDIFVRTAGGDDKLTLDFSGGNFLAANGLTVHYDGGETAEVDGDEIDVDGGTFTSMTYNITGSEEGNFSFDGNAPSIFFENVEPATITSVAGTVTINIDDGNATPNEALATSITNGGIAGDGMLFLDAPGTAEDMSFAMPTVKLEINGDVDDNDTISIDSLDTGFNAAVDVDGGGAFDTINLNTDLTLGSAAAGNTGDLTFIADVIVVDNISDGGIAIDTTAATTNGQTGNVTFTADKNILMNAGSSITTTDGEITLEANTAGTTSGSFTGIRLDDADITTGTASTVSGGAISLTGQGGTSGSTLRGILIENSSKISSLGDGTAGTITLDGTGGTDSTGTGANQGVRIRGDGTEITSNEGKIEITGQGGGGGSLNEGIRISGKAVISSTGIGMDAAEIVLDGTGGDGVSFQIGVLLTDADTEVTSKEGDISIEGTGGTENGPDDGSGNFGARGVVIQQEAAVRSTVGGVGAADILIDGAGGEGIAFDHGVDVRSGGEVTSVDGDIEIEGTGGTGGGVSSLGVLLFSGGVVETMAGGSGSIAIDGTGGSGADAAHGVAIIGLGGDVARVTSAGGSIDITGTAGSTTGETAGVFFDDGGRVEGSGMTEITVTADVGDVRMDGGGTIATEDGDVTVEAAGDVLLGTVNANSDADSDAGTVLVTADTDSTGGGAIIDFTSTETANIIAESAALRAADGIGTTATDKDIDIQVDTLAFVNSDSGDVVVTDLADGLVIDDVDGITTSSSAGSAMITAASPLTISHSMNVAASSTFTAGSDTGFTGDDLTIDGGAVVTLTSASDAVLTFAAGDNIVFGSTGPATTGRIVTTGGGTHTVNLLADQETDDTDAAGGSVTQTATGFTSVTTDELIVEARTGVGSAAIPLEVNVAELDVTNSTSGDVQIAETGAVDVNRLDQDGSGAVTLTAGGTITVVDAMSGVTATTGKVTLTANNSGSDVVINQDVTTTGGDVVLTAADMVTSTDTDDITTSGALAGDDSGTVDINAGGAVSLAGDIVTSGAGAASDGGQVDVDTTSGAIAVSDVTASPGTGGTAGDINLHAGGGSGSVTINGTLTSSAGSVRIDAAANIIDGNDGVTDVAAANVLLRAGTGVGSGVAGAATDIDTATTGASTLTLAATTATGNVNVENDGSLTIDSVGAGTSSIAALSGVSVTGATGGAVIVRASSPIDVTKDVTNASPNPITLAAEGTTNNTAGAFAGADDDLRIAANVTQSGGGNVNLFAGGDVIHTTGTVSAVGAGVILVSAGENFAAGVNANGAANASVVMSEAAMITSVNGMVTVRATKDVTLGGVESTNGTVVVTADFDNGIGTDISDGVGAINDNAGNTDADITAPNIDLYAGSGIGNLAELELAGTAISANTINGNIDLDNSSTAAVTVSSLTTGTSTAAATIDFDQSGGGDLTFSGAVTSGDGDTDGGDITLRNLTAGAGLTIDTTSHVSSESGTGGGLNISGATISGPVTAGAGTITIQGGALDIIIDTALSSPGAIGLSALRDVIIRAAVETTGTGDITLMADSDDLANPDPVLTNNAVRGGVRIEEDGFVDGAAAVTISGSNLYHDDNIEADNVADTTIESVLVDADSTVGTDQILAGGAITIRSNTNALDGASAPANADIVVNGNVTTTGATAADTIDVTANQDVSFGADGDLTGSGGQITVTADAAAGGGGKITMADGAQIDGDDGDVELTADGDVKLAEIFTTAEVRVTSENGSILDNLTAETANITAAEAALRAADGIGTTATDKDVDIQVDTLAFVNSDSGDVVVTDLAGGLEIDDVDGITQSENAGGDVILVALSPLTVNHDVIASGGGDIRLTATDDGDAPEPDNLAINADVTASGGDGEIVLTGENLFVGGFTVSTEGAGEITANVTDTTTLDASAVVETEGADITLGTDDVDFDSTASIDAGTVSGTATVFLQPTSTGRSFGLGGGAGDFNLTDDEADTITASRLEIGAADAGTFTVNDLSLASGNVPTLVLRTAADVAEGPADGSADVTVDELAILSGTGVDVDVDVTTLAVGNSGGGGIDVTDTAGGLKIGTVMTSTGNVEGATTVGGGINITASSPLTVNKLVKDTGGGDIELTSTNNGGSDDHLTINAEVQATGGDGSIMLNAGTDLIVTDSGLANDISVEGDGEITANVVRNTMLGENVNVVTEDQAITFNTDQMEIDTSALPATINAGAGNVTITPLTGGDAIPIELGSTASDAGKLQLSDAELDQISADIVIVGSAGAGAATVTAPLTLENNLTVETGGDTITAGAIVDGNHDLLLNTTGLTDINAELGGITPLASLTTNPGGTTELGADVTTGGGTMTYRDAVLLTKDVILTDTGGTGVIFESTLDTKAGLAAGLGDLTLNVTQAAATSAELKGAVFLGAVGSGPVGSGGSGPAGAKEGLGSGQGPAITIISPGTTIFRNTLQTASGITQDDAAGEVFFLDDVFFDFAPGGTDTFFNANVTIDGRPAAPDALNFNSAANVTFGNEASDVLTLFPDINFNIVGDMILNSTVIGNGGDLVFDVGSFAVNQLFNTNGGNFTVIARTGDITFSPNGSIQTEGPLEDGNVSLTADVGEILMEDGATVISGDGTILYMADGDIELTGLSSTNPTNTAVQITSTTGGVIDVGDTNVDIAAPNGRLVVRAATGVGDGNALETTIGSADVVNLAGNVELDETDDLALFQIVTPQNVILDVTNGQITDGGDSLPDIVSAGAALQTAGGIGSGNALETQLSTLAASNTTSGNIEVFNTGGLSIGTVNGLSGLTNGGLGGDIIVTAASPLTVDDPVANTSGGDVDLTSQGAGDLTVNKQVSATTGDGSIMLDAGLGALVVNNDPSVSDEVLVEGNGLIVGLPKNNTVVAPGVFFRSGTGRVTSTVPELIISDLDDSTDIPDITNTGIAEVGYSVGRPGEENFISTVEFGVLAADGSVVYERDIIARSDEGADTSAFLPTGVGYTTATGTTQAPGYVVFDNAGDPFLGGNPNPVDPAAAVFIRITMENDPNIFIGEDEVIVVVAAPIPGEGLGAVVFVVAEDYAPLGFPDNPEPTFVSTTVTPVSLSTQAQQAVQAIVEAAQETGRQVIIHPLTPTGERVIAVDENGQPILDANGEPRLVEIELDESVLNDLKKLFREMPDGRYRIYLRIRGEERLRLLFDISIRSGTVVSEQQAGTAEQDQQDPQPSSEAKPAGQDAGGGTNAGDGLPQGTGTERNLNENGAGANLQQNDQPDGAGTQMDPGSSAFRGPRPQVGPAPIGEEGRPERLDRRWEEWTAALLSSRTSAASGQPLLTSGSRTGAGGQPTRWPAGAAPADDDGSPAELTDAVTAPALIIGGGLAASTLQSLRSGRALRASDFPAVGERPSPSLPDSVMEKLEAGDLSRAARLCRRLRKGSNRTNLRSVPRLTRSQPSAGG